jgi:hypothetical protein
VSEKDIQTNKYGSGSSGHVIVDVKKRSGYFETWREIGVGDNAFMSEPRRSWSIEQLNVDVQDQVKKVLEGNVKDPN